MAHSSCWSARTAPVKRIADRSLGKTATTLKRCFTPLFSRSRGLLLQILRQCARGNDVNEGAPMSGPVAMRAVGGVVG